MTTVIAFVLGMMFGGAVGIIMAAVLMASREELSRQQTGEFQHLQWESGWISCSERLPHNKDYDETFIVTIQCEHVDGWDDYVAGYADWTPHGWDIQSYYMGQIKVTAWMPLPEPYMEVDE